MKGDPDRFFEASDHQLAPPFGIHIQASSQQMADEVICRLLQHYVPFNNLFRCSKRLPAYRLIARFFRFLFLRLGSGKWMQLQSSGNTPLLAPSPLFLIRLSHILLCRRAQLS